MKFCLIPDLHGLTDWEVVKNIPNIDKYIFLGDYVDSFHISNMQILENLKNIIKFKLENPEQVECLFGNHCIQYAFSPHYRCSGFRPEMLTDLKMLFETNRNIFNIAYQHNNYLFTHAGVCQKWLEFARHSLTKWGLNDDLSNIGEIMNKVSRTNDNWELHLVGEIRGGLRYDVGGPTWADKSETENDLISNFHQFVGHTPVPAIETVYKDLNTSITYLDTLGKKKGRGITINENDFYILEINE